MGTLGTPFRHPSIMVANSTARVMAIGALVCRNRFHLSAPDAGKRMQCSKVNIMFRSCAAFVTRQCRPFVPSYADFDVYFLG